MNTSGMNIASPTQRHVFLRDMVLAASIGIYPHEHGNTQRIRVNVDLAVDDDPAQHGIDRLDRIVSYEQVAEAVRRLVGEGHVKLVETLAERIAATCLQDHRVTLVRVRVEKLDVFADAASAGVEVARARALCPPTE